MRTNLPTYKIPKRVLEAVLASNPPEYVLTEKDKEDLKTSGKRFLKWLEEQIDGNKI